MSIMRAVEVIRKKRDGGELTADELTAFVHGATTGQHWADYQLAAMLMAIYLRGLSAAETAHLTQAMTDSGRRFRLEDIPGPKVDKHSTGGVGDKTSLILGPLAAACGVVVPMMSGRGLGHTGGTLDKLEAIPGFRVGLSEEEFRDVLRKVGLALIGQTKDVAPADRTLYALRDVTATVESIPLITASILSKKLAEGISGLVIDVKSGHGAFMKTRHDARRLAETLIQVGIANGLQVAAMITSMSTPLGRAVGNALEVIEAIETLKGRGPADLTELSVLLTVRMLQLAGVAATDTEREQRVRAALASGAGLEVFRKCIEAQGGDPRVIEDYSRLPTTRRTMAVVAPRSGYIAEMVAGAVGTASMVLGGGRERAEDRIDPAVGVICRAKPGEPVRAGEVVYEVHYRSTTRLLDVLPLLEQSVRISDHPPAAQPLVLEELG
jgi:pyrimidine-nucleoside phosphorylase